MQAAVARECLGTRQRVGMMDASTLGKIEVVGPDAAEFLDRMYVNSFSKLAIGRCRYALMLTEAGYVMDDGVVARLAADRLPRHHDDRRRASVLRRWRTFCRPSGPTSGSGSPRPRSNGRRLP